jgi:hypothetical protein
MLERIKPMARGTNSEAYNLAAYVSRIVSEAPPLTDAQRDRLAALLAPAGGASS